MTLVVTHAKVSGIADNPAAAAAGEVVPSDWNANHTLAGQAGLNQGGTGSDLTETGGTGQYLKQSSSGAAVTVGAIPQADLPAVTIRKPASASTIGILSSDIEVGIDTRTTAVTATLPSAASWATANPFGLELVIVDYYGNAGTNNITPSLNAGDSFAGAWGTSPPVINANSGILRLRPDASLPGWIVRGVN